jgi:hypothetical protein
VYYDRSSQGFTALYLLALPGQGGERIRGEKNFVDLHRTEPKWGAGSVFYTSGVNECVTG